MTLLVGVFVGGQARRFGGIAKGLLSAPGGSQTLVQRLVGVARDAWPESDVVLVGARDAYAHLDLEVVRDDPEGIGPLGGLRALLGRANRDAGEAIALACDLPYVTSSVLGRLHPMDRAVDAVAPRIGGYWQPLCASYRAAPCLEAVERVLLAGHRALHAVLDDLGARAHALSLDPEQSRALRDWDSPSDISE